MLTLNGTVKQESNRWLVHVPMISLKDKLAPAEWDWVAEQLGPNADQKHVMRAKSRDEGVSRAHNMVRRYADRLGKQIILELKDA